MFSFQNNCLNNQHITPELLKIVRLIGEYKGKEDLFKQQTPQILDVLKQTSIVHSIESSNRLEGITVTDGRLKELLAGQPDLKSRSEQEIANYKALLLTIHTNWEGIPFTPDSILKLHKDLYQYTSEVGGEWKNRDNIIAAYPDGRIETRSKPVSTSETADAMRALHDLFNDAWENKTHDPLILIPSYVLDFLCIQPFNDGNNRIARLLSLLLLYKAGYQVGRYISLEKVVENTKEGYYDTLKASSLGWTDTNHSLIPWWNYFLGVMLLGAYHEFEKRVEIARKSGAKRLLVENIIIGLPVIFRVADIEQQATGISRPTINRALAKLQLESKIRKVSSGRDASWERSDRLHLTRQKNNVK